jgi:hypothetical protein
MDYVCKLKHTANQQTNVRKNMTHNSKEFKFPKAEDFDIKAQWPYVPATAVKLGGPDAPYRKDQPKAAFAHKNKLLTGDPWPFPTVKPELPTITGHFNPASRIEAFSTGATYDSFLPGAEVKTELEKYLEKESTTKVVVTKELMDQLAKYVETDPNGKDLNSPGAKADAGKLRPWLVLGDFSRALEKVVEVGTKGANKYTDHGWLTVENAESRYLDAAFRHILALGRGEIYDNAPGGIGTKHLAQVAWNILAVLELQERNESNSN